MGKILGRSDVSRECSGSGWATVRAGFGHAAATSSQVERMLTMWLEPKPSMYLCLVSSWKDARLLSQREPSGLGQSAVKTTGLTCREREVPHPKTNVLTR